MITGIGEGEGDSNKDVEEDKEEGSKGKVDGVGGEEERWCRRSDANNSVGPGTGVSREDNECPGEESNSVQGLREID